MPKFDDKQRQRAAKARERRSSIGAERTAAAKAAAKRPKAGAMGWKKENDLKAAKKKKEALDKAAKQRRNSEMAAAFLSKKGITHVDAKGLGGDIDKDKFDREVAKRKASGLGNKVKKAREEQAKQADIKRRIKQEFAKEEEEKRKNFQKMRRMDIAEQQTFADQDQAWNLGITLEEYQALKAKSPDMQNSLGRSKMEDVSLMPVPSATKSGLDEFAMAQSRKKREKELRKKAKKRREKAGLMRTICPCFFWCCSNKKKELAIQPVL